MVTPSVRPRVLVALALGAVLPAVAPADGPNMSGRWKFNRQRSDDVREAVVEAAGPDYTTGDAKKEALRVWIRDWLMGLADQTAEHVATIEQTASQFTVWVGDDLPTIFHFGREAASRGPGGGILKVSVKWNAEQLVTEEKAEKGSGRIMSVYTLLPGGKNLLLAYRLEHDRLRKPLALRLMFDRAGNGP